MWLRLALVDVQETRRAVKPIAWARTWERSPVRVADFSIWRASAKWMEAGDPLPAAAPTRRFSHVSVVRLLPPWLLLFNKGAWYLTPSNLRFLHEKDILRRVFWKVLRRLPIDELPYHNKTFPCRCNYFSSEDFSQREGGVAKNQWIRLLTALSLYNSRRGGSSIYSL